MLFKAKYVAPFILGIGLGIEWTNKHVYIGAIFIIIGLALFAIRLMMQPWKY